MSEISPEKLTELIALILLYGDIEEFDDSIKMKRRAEEVSINLIARFLMIKSQDEEAFNSLFPEDNPYLGLLKEYVIAAGKLVDKEIGKKKD